LSLLCFLAGDEKINCKHLQEESVENYRRRFFAGFNRYRGKEPPTGFSKTPTAANALSAVCLNKKAHPINQMSF
jgi:hypothetical protein